MRRLKALGFAFDRQAAGKPAFLTTLRRESVEAPLWRGARTGRRRWRSRHYVKPAGGSTPRHSERIGVRSRWVVRNAGSPEIWFNTANHRYTTLPNHPGDIPEGTLRAILKQAGIGPDDFLGR